MIKSVVLLLFIFTFTCTTYSQKKRPRKVTWHNWYDSTAFFQGPQPLIKGFGQYSDSLSQLYGGVMIFEHNRKYYRINCLADYYYWFTRKYEFLFRKDISIYEEFYYNGDSYRLAEFVKKNYKGRKLPVKFRFPSNQKFHYPDPPFEPTNGGPPTTVRFNRQ